MCVDLFYGPDFHSSVCLFEVSCVGFVGVSYMAGCWAVSGVNSIDYCTICMEEVVRVEVRVEWYVLPGAVVFCN